MSWRRWTLLVVGVLVVVLALAYALDLENLFLRQLQRIIGTPIY